jgi:hypothetical protein
LTLDEFAQGFVGSVFSTNETLALFNSIDVNKNGKLTLTADLVSPSEVLTAIISRRLPPRVAATSAIVCQECLPASYGPRPAAR